MLPFVDGAMVVSLLGMGIDMRENTLETKSMVLVCITLQTVIIMRVHGMKVENKVLECMHSAMVTLDLGSGIVVF